MLSLTINGQTYKVASQPIDISIPMNFHGSQPNAYHVPLASARAYEGEGFVGDVRQGGSCNFEEFRFIAHCNGTHTECVGHISKARIYIHEVLDDSFAAATLISVTPENGPETDDTYAPTLSEGDTVITRNALEKALSNRQESFLEALIIRTLPNAASKKGRNYMDVPPPFFSFEAMEFVAELGVKHLLVDMPSVDRTFDEGRLSAHHIYWNVPQGSNDIDPGNSSLKTITEMIFVHDEIEDGQYLVNLQIAPFLSDAAPSRPRLFRISAD